MKFENEEVEKCFCELQKELGYFHANCDVITMEVLFEVEKIVEELRDKKDAE